MGKITVTRLLRHNRPAILTVIGLAAYTVAFLAWGLFKESLTNLFTRRKS